MKEKRKEQGANLPLFGWAGGITWIKTCSTSPLGSALIVWDYKGLMARNTGVNKLSSGLSEWTLAAIMKSSLASAERFLGL